MFEAFEKRLDQFKENISRSQFFGAEKITGRLDGIIREQC